jgi:hypothetical protein
MARLVLHFDVNETIMVGDPAGGDTFEESLNKIISKSAVVRCMPIAEQAGGGRWPDWRWHDGSPLDPELRAMQGLTQPPPLLEGFEFDQQPEGCVSFYKADELKRAFAKRFTADGPGVIYRGLYEQLERALRCEPTMDKRLCHDGRHHFLLPAFFHTLSALRDAGRSYSLVMRTFGTDGEHVADAICAFAEGAHAGYGAVPELADSLRSSPLWRGKYCEQGGRPATFVLKASSAALATPDKALNEAKTDKAMAAHALRGVEVNNEMEVEATLIKTAAHISAACCRDDYDWWKAHGYDPSAGKPLWVTTQDSSVHPIFFDDNIHNDPKDSIVAVRVRATAADTYSTLSGNQTLRMQGLVLQRTPTFAPILDETWFLRQIDACESRLARARAESGDQWCPIPTHNQP